MKAERISGIVVLLGCPGGWVVIGIRTSEWEDSVETGAGACDIVEQIVNFIRGKARGSSGEKVECRGISLLRIEGMGIGRRGNQQGWKLSGWGCGKS
jgi:hypothetical protein